MHTADAMQQQNVLPAYRCSLSDAAVYLLPLLDLLLLPAVIQPGQGLFYSSISQTYRARNCDDNTYGVPTRFYGLTAFPCRWD